MKILSLFSNADYPRPLLTLFFAIYFCVGLRMMLVLVVKDLFRLYLLLDPAETQFFTSFIVIPLSLKPIYGVISDNVPFLGSLRLNYIRATALFAALFQLLAFFFCTSNKYAVLAILTSLQITNAVKDVVTDALLIAVSRKNPERGAEDLQSMRYATIAFGGLIGSAFGAWYTEHFHPRYVFLIQPFPLVLIFVLSLYVEEEQESGMGRQSE